MPVDRKRRLWPGCWCAALIASLLPAAAAGRGLNLGGATQKGPISISAASGIEWQQDRKVYIARGHAVAKRGATEVDADTLTAHYRQTKGGSEIYRVDAVGHVVIKGPSDRITGDHAVYDADQAVVIVTGKALKLTTASDVVTARDSLEWYENKELAVARGDAVVLHQGKRIRAHVLTAYLSPAHPAAPAHGKAAAMRSARAKPKARAGDIGSGMSRIRRIDAQGNVVVSTATDVGRSNYGVYDAKTGIVTLIGHVVLAHGQDVLRGQYAVMDLNRNVSRMMSVAAKPGQRRPRVEGVFVRQKSGADRAAHRRSGGPAR